MWSVNSHGIGFANGKQEKERKHLSPKYDVMVSFPSLSSQRTTFGTVCGENKQMGGS